MKLTKLTIFLCLGLLVLSCGKKSKKKSEVVSQNPVEALEVTQKETVTFHRLEKMTTQYNCNGEIISRKPVTQNALRKKITVDYEKRKEAWGFSVSNPRDKRFILLNHQRFKNGTFTIDFASNPFNVLVKEGINNIVYEFRRCPKIIKDPQRGSICEAPLEIEKKGIIQLDVYYSSELLPEENIIRPSKESCKEEALKAPKELTNASKGSGISSGRGEVQAP